MRMRESAVALVLLIIVDALDGSNPNAADSRQGESREVEELVFPSTIGIVDRSALDRRWKRSAKALEQRCRCHDRDEYRELFELVHAVAPEHAVIALDREGTADHTGPEYHRLKCVIETAATEIRTEVVHVQTLELYRQQRGEVGKIDLLVLPVDRHSSELIGSEAQKWLVAGFSNESFVWDVWRGSAIVLVGTNMQDGQDKSGGVAAGIEFAMRVSGTVFDPAESFDGWYVGCPDSPGCIGGGDATRWAGGSNNGVGEEEWRLIHTPTVGGVTTLLQLPHPAFAQPSHTEPSAPPAPARTLLFSPVPTESLRNAAPVCLSARPPTHPPARRSPSQPTPAFTVAPSPTIISNRSQRYLALRGPAHGSWLLWWRVLRSNP